MAAAALPFMHHKLPTITPDEYERPEELDEFDRPDETSLDLSKLTPEEREQLKRIMAKADTRR
jgi:hypothetical protein